MTTRPARTVSVSIDRAPDAVYRYLVDPHHLPTWAPGFATAVHREPAGWVAETAGGRFQVAFAPHNRFGVVDHRVTSDDGVDDTNPMRVIANGTGSEVLFTLFHPVGADDAAFEATLAVVASDLRTLKGVLESLEP
ncbi:SRPBCC family protein [Pengzhenrongella sicca]|uniref:SRPBCC family protein n=1 Tax=Pengzhenrongella sicca TaxID=2819238 RepID=A0A8A4Z8M3_9MICO|nr:SRPBCC family protein [Pengzhenrongella sicca]QTE28270.1 SRPBCC family protein [Pengzhenrongella sicca]